jgi:thymidylate kinase
MSEQEEVGQLVAAVFRAWDKAGIEFLILRNYEGLPNVTTNDIDVLVAPEQVRRAEETLLAAAEGAGFRLHNRAEFASLALYLSGRQSNAQAHFDLFTELKWRGFEFLSCREFLGRRVRRGLFAVPHVADEAASNLLDFLIYKGQVKPKYKPSIAVGFRTEPAVATKLLAQTYGAAHARFLVSAGAQEQWPAIEAAAGALRRAMVVRQLTRHLWRTTTSMLGDATRLVRRFLRPPGLTVVLCGADGCGKSTAARAIEEGLSGTFSLLKGRHFHWKPPLFSTRRRAARGAASDPHGKPPRNPAASFCYFLFHWLEFFLGSHLRFRPITFRGGLVLVDRYYYDFFVDQRRYRLRVPQGLVRLGYVFVKKPDLVLLLDAPAEVLQSRKQEVPPAETERQCRAYRALVENLSNGRIINAAPPVEKVGVDINRVILDFMAQRQVRK